MPTARGGKQKKEDATLKELKEIKFLLRNLLEEEKKDAPPNKWRKALSQFGFGIVKGLGIVIGATIVAGLLFLALRFVLASIDLENWFADLIDETITDSLDGFDPVVD